MTSADLKKHSYLDTLKVTFSDLVSTTGKLWPFYLLPIFEQENEKGFWRIPPNLQSNNSLKGVKKLYSKFLHPFFLIAKCLLLKAILQKNKKLNAHHLWITYGVVHKDDLPNDLYDSDFKNQIFSQVNRNSLLLFYLPTRHDLRYQLKLDRNLKRHEYHSIYSEFTLLTFLKLFLKSTKAFKLSQPPIEFKNEEFKKIIDLEIKNLSYFHALIIDVCFCNMNRKYHFNNIIYPFENLRWEKSLNYHFQKSTKKRIGFLHSSVPKFYLNFFLNLDSQLSPTHICTNSTYNHNMLENYWGDSTLFPGGNLRYSTATKVKWADSSKDYIYLILPISPSDCTKILLYLDQNLRNPFFKEKIKIKLHPNYTPKNLPSYFNSNYVEWGPNLIFANAHSFIICNSSFSFEAIQAGYPFSILKCHQRESDPTDGMLSANFYTSLDNLAERIKEMIGDPEKFILKSKESFTFISPSIQKWTDIIYEN